MVKTLDRDAEALHRALAVAGDEVRVSLSRETAELVARVVDARVRGQRVLLTRGNTESHPNEAAVLLGMSRPQVRKLLDQGLLEFREGGGAPSHSGRSIEAFLGAERPRRRAALADLAHVQNELGLTE